MATDLQGADLSFSDFTNANLVTAKLNGARGAVVRFDNANLSGAELLDTGFTQASFADANLVRAKVRNAGFRKATLAGADITGTDVWQALLYQPRAPSRRQNPEIPEKVESIDQLVKGSLAIMDHYADSDDPLVDAVLYFRGHESDEWELRPSVMRSPPAGDSDVRGKEGEMLLDLMSRRPEEFGQMTTALSQWVLAQHHGLRTRLLDVTRNPLVALFAACENRSISTDTSQGDGLLHVFVVPRHLVKAFDSDSISVVANFAKLPIFEQNLLLGKSIELADASRRRAAGQSVRYDAALYRLYHLIGREKPHFMRRIEPRDFFRVFVVEPEQSFQRIRAQSGAFLVSAAHERYEPNAVLEWNPDIPVYDHYEFRVPAGLKERILRELRLLNVTRETLFPGLDEAAREIMRHHG